MGLNIEFKARCVDHKSVEEIMHKMNFPFKGTQQHTDTFFNVPNGQLKVREYGNKTSELIPFVGPDTNNPRAKDFICLPVKDPNQTIDLFEEILGIRLVVEKNRKIYEYDNILINLDFIEDLGYFIALEGIIRKPDEREETLQKIELLMELFEIKDEDIVLNNYVDMIEKTKGK